MLKHVLEAKHVSKKFPGTLALDDVSVSFGEGAVHAVLGKNGSGKSTLMKIFSGVYKATKGEIFLDGKNLDYDSTEQALASGIATVYQELSVVKDLTVAENLLIGKGKMPMKGKFQIDWKEVQKRAREILDYLKVNIDTNAYVRELTVGQQQLVEIAKAMLVNPKVLILDEPTSALSDSECERLFEVIKELKKKGLIILFISHRLQEIFKIADTVTVLRDGLLVGTENIKDIDSTKLINMMFGDVEHSPKTKSYVVDEVVLEAKGICSDKIKNVSLQLKKGEILGVAGMLGAGRTELLRLLYGLDKMDKGELFIDGAKIEKITPYRMKNRGCGFASENRKEEGLCLNLSVGDNLVMANLNAISPKGQISRNLEKQYIEGQISELDIKVADYNLPATSLSGGNQQKVVIGNWLNTKPRILFMDEPSRGIDINAKQQIFNVLYDEASKGVATIMVSSELEELLEVCDRILIMHGGKVTGEVKASELTVETIYSLCIQEEAYEVQ